MEKNLKIALILFVCGILVWVSFIVFAPKLMEKKATKQHLTPLEQEAEVTRQIIYHYEKIDSLIIVRDSINTTFGRLPIGGLQKAIDSVYNR
jgi:hypothetical protein